MKDTMDRSGLQWELLFGGHGELGIDCFKIELMANFGTCYQSGSAATWELHPCNQWEHQPVQLYSEWLPEPPGRCNPGCG